MKKKPDTPKPSGRPGHYLLSLPATLSITFFYGALLLYGLTRSGTDDRGAWHLLLGIAGIVYSTILFYFVLPKFSHTHRYRWLLTVANASGLSLLTVALDRDLVIILYVLTILAAVITAIGIGRSPAFVLILIVAANHLLHSTPPPHFTDWITITSPYLAAFALAETLVRLQDANRHHLRRLETLSHFARQISASIETEQVIASLHRAIQDSFDADTYYVAFLRDERLEFSLLYDDGEYFHDQEISLNESLAGRVVLGRQALFLPDLVKAREELGFRYSTIGKDKVNLSWMGSPLTSGDELVGVLAVASYKLNAFDRADFDLLQNLAQQASLAIDNARHHAEVEAQSRLDSLTKVYHHGYFLEFLHTCAQHARANNRTLSLIMLDVDQFKQYNDTYGHLVGDKVLVALTGTIRQHIQATDGVGRWGGEEFAIALLDVDGPQALQIAGRICESVRALQITDRDGQPIPAPTVSQGIAIYPDEADDIYGLVDLADRRLYVAKEHGRNQVQPDEKHWKAIKSPQDP